MKYQRLVCFQQTSVSAILRAAPVLIARGSRSVAGWVRAVADEADSPSVRGGSTYVFNPNSGCCRRCKHSAEYAAFLETKAVGRDKAIRSQAETLLEGTVRKKSLGRQRERAVRADEGRMCTNRWRVLSESKKYDCLCPEALSLEPQDPADPRRLSSLPLKRQRLDGSLSVAFWP